MKLNNFVKKLKNNYTTDKVECAKTLNFKPSSVVRKRIIFSGKVQRVGFRYEMYTLAEQLNLTGWVRNRDYNKVELEIQGEEDKIFFLISHMKSLKRATVTHVEIDEISIINDETDFIVIR